MMGPFKRRRMIISGQAPRSEALSISNSSSIIKCDIKFNQPDIGSLFLNDKNTKKQPSIINYNWFWFLFFITIYSLFNHYCYASSTTSTIISSSKSSHNLNNRSNTAIRFLTNQNKKNNNHGNDNVKNRKQLNLSSTLSSARFSPLINSRSQSKFSSFLLFFALC